MGLGLCAQSAIGEWGRVTSEAVSKGIVASAWSPGSFALGEASYGVVRTLGQPYGEGRVADS